MNLPKIGEKVTVRVNPFKSADQLVPVVDVLPKYDRIVCEVEIESQRCATHADGPCANRRACNMESVSRKVRAEFKKIGSSWDLMAVQRSTEPGKSVAA